MNQEEAKAFVLKTILTGDSKKIARVIKRYREVYGKVQHGSGAKSLRSTGTVDSYQFAQEIFSEEKELQSS